MNGGCPPRTIFFFKFAKHKGTNPLFIMDTIQVESIINLNQVAAAMIGQGEILLASERLQTALRLLKQLISQQRRQEQGSFHSSTSIQQASTSYSVFLSKATPARHFNDIRAGSDCFLDEATAISLSPNNWFDLWTKPFEVSMVRENDNHSSTQGTTRLDDLSHVLFFNLALALHLQGLYSGQRTMWFKAHRTYHLLRASHHDPFVAASYINGDAENHRPSAMTLLRLAFWNNLGHLQCHLNPLPSPANHNFQEEAIVHIRYLLHTLFTILCDHNANTMTLHAEDLVSFQLLLLHAEMHPFDHVAAAA